MLDGATNFIDFVRIASIGMFVCVFCDIAAALVFFAALIYLKPKETE